VVQDMARSGQICPEACEERVARLGQSSTLRKGYLRRLQRTNRKKATQVWYSVQRIHLGIDWHSRAHIDHWHVGRWDPQASDSPVYR